MAGVSGVGSTSGSGSSSSPQGTLGNVPPVTFPGIASGIDYNAIIEKLTSLTLAQNQPLTTQSNNLTAANSELVKINGLIQKVQQAITNLGDPTLFSNFSATSSNTSLATALQTPGQVPSVGTTTILSQTLATATQIASDPAANKPVNTGVSLATAGFQITPSNGSPTGTGKFTINGQTISYDVNTDTVTTILAKINALTGVSATFQNDQLTITSTSGPLSLGSASDTGNLEQIFKLDVAPVVSGQQEISAGTTGGSVVSTSSLATYGVTASGILAINGHNFSYAPADTVGSLESQINAVSGLHAAIQGGKLVIETTDGSALSISDTGNFQTTFNGGFSAPAGYSSVTSAANVGGINPAVTLNTVNSSTPLNSGTTFSINGVAISIDPATQNLQDVINAINNSKAGVTAGWNATLGQLQLVAKSTGPQSIVLGAPGDSSNFLQAFGLTTAGATTQVGQQASVTYQTPSGGSATVYSSSNQVTNVIPGVTLSLLQTSTTPYTVTVAPSNSKLVTAVNDFVTAYNAAIEEINSATAPPVVKTAGPGTPIQAGATQSQQVVPGGPLFANSSVQSLKDQLVSMVSGIVQTGSTSYNSFQSIGLQLDNSIAVITSDSTSSSSDSKSSSDSGGLQTQTYDGTSGKLQPLDATTLDSALAADPSAVQSIFTSQSGILAQLGTYLTYVTGTPTQLGPNGNFLGTSPDTALLQGLENANSAQIDSINQQIAMVNDMAIAQANQLRAEFTASETMIAQLQAEQQSLSSIIGGTGASTSSTGG
jgi:flagellar hook-associated protein 2